MMYLFLVANRLGMFVTASMWVFPTGTTCIDNLQKIDSGNDKRFTTPKANLILKILRRSAIYKKLYAVRRKGKARSMEKLIYRKRKCQTNPDNAYKSIHTETESSNYPYCNQSLIESADDPDVGDPRRGAIMARVKVKLHFSVPR